MKLVFFNGPPGCGKDTATRFAVERFGGLHLSVAAPVKCAVHELLAVPAAVAAEIERTPALKDVASPWFFGQTPRQAYIAMSEQLARPLYGTDVLGRLAVRRLRADPDASYAFVSDGGFRTETDVIVAAVGAHRTLLVRIQRAGCSFTGDSRSALDMSDLAVTTVSLENNGSLERFREAVVGAIETWAGSVAGSAPGAP